MFTRKMTIDGIDGIIIRGSQYCLLTTAVMGGCHNGQYGMTKHWYPSLPGKRWWSLIW